MADPTATRAPEPADAEEAYRQAVRRDLPRNFLAHLGHGLLGQTGFRLIQAPTFIPAYIEALSGSPLAVGAARALQSLGMFLSPVVGASSIEHRRRVLPVGFLVGGLMRLQLLGLALAGFLLSRHWALVSVFLFLGLFGFFMGMQGVVFSFLVSKVIPVERRGLLMGLRGTLSGITAGAVGIYGGRLIEAKTLGNGYASIFAIAFVLTSLGLACLLLVREPKPPSMRAPTPLGQRLRELPDLLREDAAFTRFFLARALAAMGRMSVPFYVIYAKTKLTVGGVELGELTLAFVLAQSGTNLLWGLMADRWGFRSVFLASLSVWIGSALLLMASAKFTALLGVMVGLGAGIGGFMLSAQNLVLEFGARESLPMRIAVANSAAGLVGTIGPLAGGILASTVSYVAVFWTAIGFQVTGMLWVLLGVEDPRRRRSARASSSRKARGEG